MFRRYEYSNDKQIETQTADQTNDFIWVSFAKNSSGNCIIEKQYAYDPFQTFFSITRAVDNITAMLVSGNNLYVSYNDSLLLGEIINSNNPLSSTTDIPIPVGITEAPVDVAVDGSDLFYLIPGNTSGNNAKVIKYSTSGTLDQIIDLSTVTNASGFVVDTNSDIWIVTNTDPVTLVRVYDTGGGSYNYSEHP